MSEVTQCGNPAPRAEVGVDVEGAEKWYSMHLGERGDGLGGL
jgi:hypothetical protein